MKPNELMIGDWVYAIDDNGEKHPCRANNLEYDYTNKRGDFCVDFYGTGYEAEWPDVAFNVEPIPLTPEILEKNGFKYYGKTLVLSDDFYDITMKEWSDTIFVFRYTSSEFSTTPFIQVSLCYVHELQHALRLCGVDKEIVV